MSNCQITKAEHLLLLIMFLPGTNEKDDCLEVDPKSLRTLRNMCGKKYILARSTVKKYSSQTTGPEQIWLN